MGSLPKCLFLLIVFSFFDWNVPWISQILFIHIHYKSMCNFMDGWVVFINISSECWSTLHSTLRNPACLDEADDVNQVYDENQITFWYFIQVFSLIFHQAGSPLIANVTWALDEMSKQDTSRDDCINLITPPYIFTPANVWP